MFRVEDVYSKTSTTLVYTYKDEEVKFTIGSIISNRSKSDLNDPNQFTLLNAYLEYKGDNFKKALFDKYHDLSVNVVSLIMRETLPLPENQVSLPILNMFDFKDVYNFLVNVYGFRAPSTLGDVFDFAKEKDGLITRVQTYIKTDYLELATLAVICKSILGPICMYADIKEADIYGNFKEYILSGFITGSYLSKTPPMIKLKASIDKTIEKHFQSKPDERKTFTLEKGVPEETMNEYVLAIALIQKVCIATILTDSNEKNIVTIIYNYAINLLRTKSDSNKKIVNKQPLTNSDGSNERDNKESIMESYRIPTDITPGETVEFSVVLLDIDMLIYHAPVKVDKALVLLIKQSLHVFKHRPLAEIQTLLMGMVLKDIINPKAFMYVGLEEILNALSITFAVLWTMGYHRLAVLVTSVSNLNDSNEGVMSLNPGTNRKRLTEDETIRLEKHYLLGRVMNTTKTSSVILESVNKIGNAVYDLSWSPTVPNKLHPELKEAGVNLNILPNDIKGMLANFFCDIEDIRTAHLEHK